MTTFVSPFTGDVILPTDVSYADYTLDGDVQLQWPSDATGTENPAARIMDITGDTGVLIMPTANQVSVGQDALIRNVSGIDFDVNNFDGGVIVTVEAGKASYLYLTSNASTAGELLTLVQEHRLPMHLYWLAWDWLQSLRLSIKATQHLQCQMDILYWTPIERKPRFGQVALVR